MHVLTPRRLLGVWCGLALLGGVIAAATTTSPATVRVTSATTTTSTTAPATTSPTPSTSSTASPSEPLSSPAPSSDQATTDTVAAAPPALELSPGVWLVRPDGSEAVALGDNLADHWFDSSSIYVLDARAGALVRVTLSGVTTVLAPPDGPRWNGPGTQGRRILQVSVAGGRAAYHWVHVDDPGSGFSIGPADMSSSIDLDRTGTPSVAPLGDRIALADGQGVWIYDANGTQLGGPYAGPNASFGAWSSDDRHVVVALDSTSSCVLDTVSGSCAPAPLGHDVAIGAGLLGDGQTIMAGVHGIGDEDDQIVVGPASGPFTTIVEHARFEYVSPTSDQIVYSDFPYFHPDRTTNVHTIDPSGHGDQIIATARPGLLATTCGYSPDGGWVLVRVFANHGGG